MEGITKRFNYIHILVISLFIFSCSNDKFATVAASFDSTLDRSEAIREGITQ